MLQLPVKYCFMLCNNPFRNATRNDQIPVDAADVPLQWVHIIHLHMCILGVSCDGCVCSNKVQTKYTQYMNEVYKKGLALFGAAS